MGWKQAYPEQMRAAVQRRIAEKYGILAGSWEFYDWSEFKQHCERSPNIDHARNALAAGERLCDAVRRWCQLHLRIESSGQSGDPSAEHEAEVSKAQGELNEARKEFLEITGTR